MHNYSNNRIPTLLIAGFTCLAGVTDSGATDYSGPIDSLIGQSVTIVNKPFSTPGPTLITPSASPGTAVYMLPPFSHIGTAMKAADFGSGANESVFLRTSTLSQNSEVMESLNIQDTRSSVPSTQVKSLTVMNINGSLLVTMVMGQQSGGSPALQLLDPALAGYAATSIIGRKASTIETGTVYVYNTLTNIYEPVNNIVTGMTVNQ